MLNQLKDILFWYRSTWEYLKFQQRALKDLIESPSETKSFIVVVEVWKTTPLPFFAITLAMLLYKKKYPVKILLNDIAFHKENLLHKIQVFTLNKLLNAINAKVTSEKLSNHLFEIDDLISEVEKNELYKLAFANAVHRNLGEIKGNNFNNETNFYYKKYLKVYQSIRNYVVNNKDNYYIIPGGIYGYTGLILSCVKKSKADFFTYDSGFGVILTSINDVAAHCKDIYYVANEIIKDGNKLEIEKVKGAAIDELNKRVNGTNSFRTQYQNIKDSLKVENVGVLIPLNSPWDSAALNIDSVFSSYLEWLVETVRIVLVNTEENVTIRQHPDERHWYGKSNLDFKKILLNEFGVNPRIQFISSSDKVNTYALLSDAKVVICFSSTFGVEAVLHNKKVVVCSNVYYSEMSFVQKPKDKEELISMLRDLENVKVSSQQLDEAAITFYLGQKCNWLYTSFTPGYGDFKVWVTKNLNDIYQLEGVDILLETILTKIPLSYIQHKRNLV